MQYVAPQNDRYDAPLQFLGGRSFKKLLFIEKKQKYFFYTKCIFLTVGLK